MNSVNDVLKWVQEDLDLYLKDNSENSLFQPIHYLLKIGGKRMRPALVILTNEMLGGNVNDARPAALAIEVFHNFTLMHDDIMDQAPLRRGKPTVHEKFNTNKAILSGDAMLIEAYKILTSTTTPHLKKLIHIFNETALGVCLGQEYDMAFETRSDVTIEEYIEMIRLKTAVLLGGAMEMGGVIANASEEDSQHLNYIGQHLGIAFQLRDDYLDAFGNPETFGKQVGGDILANKKTMLYLDMMHHIQHHEKEELLAWPSGEEKIQRFKEAMIQSGAVQRTLDKINFYSNSALNHLDLIHAEGPRKLILRELILNLLDRQA
jgi:geranylgeranyl diphosphate synthase type II